MVNVLGHFDLFGGNSTCLPTFHLVFLTSDHNVQTRLPTVRKKSWNFCCDYFFTNWIFITSEDHNWVQYLPLFRFYGLNYGFALTKIGSALIWFDSHQVQIQEHLLITKKISWNICLENSFVELVFRVIRASLAYSSSRSNTRLQPNS